MQVRFSRLAVLVIALSVAAAGCGRYSISNIRSAKAFQDATALYKRADYKGAAAGYEEAVRLNPNMGFAYFFLGNSYEYLYKPGKDDPDNMAYLTKAAENYRAAIDKLAGSTNAKEQEVRRNAYEYLIALYSSSDKIADFTKAEPVAKEMIAGNPTEPATYRVLAKIYEDEGRFDEAEAALLKSVEVRPSEALGYQFLATFYNERGEFEKSMETWNRRAEAEPKNPEAWHTIGLYYQDKVTNDKRLPRQQALDYVLKGIEAEDKALSLNPEYYLAVVYKNILLRQQAVYEKDPAKQKKLIEEADILYKKGEVLRVKQGAVAIGKGGGK